MLVALQPTPLPSPASYQCIPKGVLYLEGVSLLGGICKEPKDGIRGWFTTKSGAYIGVEVQYKQENIGCDGMLG